MLQLKVEKRLVKGTLSKQKKVQVHRDQIIIDKLMDPRPRAVSVRQGYACRQGMHSACALRDHLEAFGKAALEKDVLGYQPNNKKDNKNTIIIH